MTQSALDVIEREHEVLAQLFHEVSRVDVDRDEVLKRLVRRTAEHVSVEQSVLHPIVKERHLGGPDLADELQHDYDEMGRLLGLIERRKINSPDMPDLVTDLMDVTAAHRDRADSVLAPAMRREFDASELNELGARMTSAQTVILSHPHPHLLGLGPLSRLTTRLASLQDRWRDRLVNNRTGQ